MVFPLQPRVIASWIFVLTAFIISILLLLAGTKPGFLANAALLIFYQDDTLSQFGLRDTTGPLRIMYFLSLCEPNVQSDSLSLGGTFGYLTYDGTATATTDVTCVMGPNVTASQGRLYHIATLLWIIGVVTSGFSVLVMPIFIRGLIHLTGWMLTFLWIPWITFMAGAIMTTVNGTLLHRYNGVVGNLLLPLLWTTVICMLIGITIFTFEYSLEKHTPKGERISSRFKPVAVQRVSYSNARVSRTVVYDEDPVIKMTQVRVTATTG